MIIWIHRRGMDAVTLQAVAFNETASGHNQHQQSYYTTGDVLQSLERLIRSLNNLESRLYHVSRFAKHQWSLSVILPDICRPHPVFSHLYVSAVRASSFI